MTTLFRPDEGIAIGVGSRKPDGQLDIDGGVVRTWEKWHKCKRPLSDWNNGHGLFYRVNPMKHGGKSDKDVTDFRYGLLECDLNANGQPIPKEVQFAFYRKFNLPIIALIDSGDKSLHAIVHVDAADRAQFDERLNVILSLFPVNSVDPSNKNPSTYTRLPGFARENGRRNRRYWLSILVRLITPPGRSSGRYNRDWLPVASVVSRFSVSSFLRRQRSSMIGSRKERSDTCMPFAVSARLGSSSISAPRSPWVRISGRGRSLRLVRSCTSMAR